MPPTTVATKAKSTSGTPILNERVPVCATNSSETTAARKPLMANAVAITRSPRTPSSRAIRKSSDAARIWMPMAVRRRKNTNRTSSPRVTEIVMMWS